MKNGEPSAAIRRYSDRAVEDLALGAHQLRDRPRERQRQQREHDADAEPQPQRLGAERRASSSWPAPCRRETARSSRR